MKVPFFELKTQFASIRQEILPAIQDVFESQSFILGNRGKELEQQLAAYCRLPHALGVASGTDALLVTLRALGVQAGDGVLTTPFTFFATAGAIHNLGAIPIFIDIDPQTYQISPAKIADFLEGRSRIAAHQGLLSELLRRGRIRALIPVHLYGQMAPMAEIIRVASVHRLAVLEDAAQSIGACQDVDLPNTEPRKAGAWGDAGAISFFPTKNLGASGDAGLVVTSRQDLADHVRMLRVHGSHTKYMHQEVGWNSRLDELQAAVLLAKLPHLDSWNEARRQNAEQYEKWFRLFELPEKCRLPLVARGNTHIYHQFVVATAERDSLREFLRQREIGTEVYYPCPLHLQECFSYLGYRPGDLPEAERASQEVLALPIFPELRPEQIRFVAESIRDYYYR
jgi:dTDP-4-amino-4,6-dideoxygalactose transaminase